MFEYDKVLFEMNEQTYDIADEKRLIAILTQKLKKKFYEEEIFLKVSKKFEKVSYLYLNNLK